MKEEIKEICTELNDGKIAVVQAIEKLLDLFSVSGCYSIEDVKQAVNFWSMTDVEKKYIEAFFNNR